MYIIYRFPNIILTRRKQSDLKKMNNLYSFGEIRRFENQLIIWFFVCLDNSNTSHPFSGNNMRSRIALYQLKKCQLDFRLVIKSEKTDEFIDTKVFCRSDELIEGNYFSHLIFFLIVLCFFYSRRDRMEKIINISFFFFVKNNSFVNIFDV
jgi:hypothetical protein